MGIILQSASPAPTDRERIWAAIRALARSGKEITTANVCRKTGLDRRTGKVGEYMTSLERGGFLRVVSERKPGMFLRYALARDVGVDAPRVTGKGELLPPSGRTRMWRAMRILQTFTLAELVNAASLPEAPIADSEAETYCNWLRRGGYLHGGKGRWAFVPAMNTGPRAPRILRVSRLYDPNRDAVIYESAAQGRDDL
ncbi:hypothetical protein [uncultured Desulfovibrio sp.]|uniref:hypothetical protein n=1 Tax=uncultured Desulfovibrio sp. TaxID=167968 RepID=UPI002616953A|nr:hypothetical protein [uncultured Desulfovibrio sp.]